MGFKLNMANGKEVSVVDTSYNYTHGGVLMNQPVMDFADRWIAAEKLVTEQYGIELVGLRCVDGVDVSEYQRQCGIRGIKIAVDHNRKGAAKPDGVSIYFHFDDGQDVMVIQQLA